MNGGAPRDGRRHDAPNDGAAATATAPATLTVDGRTVEAAGTLLDACRAAGAEVPVFCHDEGLPGGGHCRACMVEVDGEFVAACVTPAAAGARVRTDGPDLQAYRRDLGELLRSIATPAGEVGAALEAWGVSGQRYEKTARTGPMRDRSHPYLRLDLDRCILCRRCVQVCEEIEGRFVFAIAGRGATARLHWSGGRFTNSGCSACGACVDACPTGAITDADRDRPAPGARAVRTTCPYCGVGCALDVHVDGGRIVRVDPADGSANRAHLCLKGRFAHGFVGHPDRLTTPLVRRGDRLVEASWDEAIATIAAAFAGLRGRIAGLSSSRCTNEENYLLQKWMRAGLGTNDVDSCARVCHAPSAAGMQTTFGTGAATNSFDDIERADLLMVVGANSTVAHPVVGARIVQAVLRGAKLIVVDPRRTELAGIADLHLAVRPGANLALLDAMACTIVEEGMTDRDFVAERVDGWEAYAPWVRGCAPEQAEVPAGVPAVKIRQAARMYARAERPMILHGLGVTEHVQGSEGVMALCNLALLRGAVGRPGVGVNPLRGQNNVQGAADMGCDPAHLPGYFPIDDVAARARFEAAWGRPVPVGHGRTLPEMLEAAERGDVAAMFILGEDPMVSEPHTARVRAALERLQFLVVQELFLSDTAKLAHVVLPGASAFEKDGTFTNGERRVQRVRAAVPPPGTARADWRTLCALMEATGLPQPFEHPSEVMDEIASLLPDFAGISYPRLENGGLQWPVPSPDHPGTAVLHEETFPIGRARLACAAYAPTPEAEGPLTLVTGRVLEHYNTGAMTRRTPNLALRPDDALEIHPGDAASRGIKDGAAVVIASARGEARATARLTVRVPRGVVFLSFHFTGTAANAVTGDGRDRISDCPEYKVSAVEVRPAE